MIASLIVPRVGVYQRDAKDTARHGSVVIIVGNLKQAFKKRP